MTTSNISIGQTIFNATFGQMTVISVNGSIVKVLVASTNEEKLLHVDYAKFQNEPIATTTKRKKQRTYITSDTSKYIPVEDVKKESDLLDLRVTDFSERVEAEMKARARNSSSQFN